MVFFFLTCLFYSVSQRTVLGFGIYILVSESGVDNFILPLASFSFRGALTDSLSEV